MIPNDWVERGDLPAHTAHGLRREVVRDLMDTLGASLGGYHTIVIIGGEAYVHDVLPQGDDARMEVLRALSGRALSEFADLTPAVASRVNHFGETTDDDLRENRLYESVWVPLQLVSCVSMNAVVGGAIVGWVGAWRLQGEGTFGAASVRRVQSRADAYIQCLEVATRLEGRSVGARGLILLSADGEVTFACAAGRSWQSNEGLLASIREAIRSTAPLAPFSTSAAIVRLTRVDGENGERLYCADVVPVDAWKIPELGSCTPQQRRVAELAALGSSSREIALSLRVSDSTVRTYLKQIYEKLGIATRVELAERVRDFATNS